MTSRPNPSESCRAWVGQKLGLGAVVALVSSALLLGCVTVPRARQFVGTWKVREGGPYYLRVYRDGHVAIWPSPPDGRAGWTTLHGDTLALGYEPPLHDPTLRRRGAFLVMDTNVSSRSFDRLANDLEPPR